jgi:hypothetical protein
MTPFLGRWRDEEGDLHVLGLVRVAVGALLLANAVRAARELASGYFGDAFHWPLLPESLVPSRPVYGALVAAQLVLALLVVAGPRARDALLASALLGAYVLFCDRLGFHNNRWALFLDAALLAFSPCDRRVRLGKTTGPATGPLWAARLAQAQVSLVYLASGGSKLLDPDWRSGQVLLERFHLYGGQAVAAGVPSALVDALSRPPVTALLAALAIATELFLSAGLWLPRARLFALAWGLWFHLSIEATSRVEGFTWLTVAMYALFVTPEVRARLTALVRRAPLTFPFVLPLWLLAMATRRPRRFD